MKFLNKLQEISLREYRYRFAWLYSRKISLLIFDYYTCIQKFLKYIRLIIFYFEIVIKSNVIRFILERFLPVFAIAIFNDLLWHATPWK